MTTISSPTYEISHPGHSDTIRKCQIMCQMMTTTKKASLLTGQIVEENIDSNIKLSITVSFLPDRYFLCFDGARKVYVYPPLQSDCTRHDFTKAR